jgi:hypothetical protein
MLEFIDFEVLKDLQNALEPAKLKIEVLSRNNTTHSLFSKPYVGVHAKKDCRFYKYNISTVITTFEKKN